jgi:hypothetical protein
MTNEKDVLGDPVYVGWAKPAVIIVKNDGTVDERVVGPFKDGETASRFGFAKLQGRDWYWLPIEEPRLF